MNTRPKDTSLGGYFTQSQKGSPIRRVFENNMDEFSFNTVDESILKTINSTHQAYFDLVSTIKENVKFGCKVWKDINSFYLLIWKKPMKLSTCNYISYARHHNPLLIRNCSWLLTIHKDRIFQKKTPWKQRNGLQKVGKKNTNPSL